MERKYFQIRMDDMQHGRMKLRSKQLSVPIGEYVENLVASMESKIKKAYEITGIKEGLIDELMIRVFIRDDFPLNKQELTEKLMKVKESTSTTTDIKTLSIDKDDYKATITL